VDILLHKTQHYYLYL